MTPETDATTGAPVADGRAYVDDGAILIGTSKLEK